MEQKAVYVIVLTVRGKRIVKKYRSEREWKRWYEAYKAQLEHSQDSGVEQVETDKVFR